jgi:hypothetical protein
MWTARAGFPPGTRAQKTRFWRPTTRSGWAPFFFLLSCSLKSRSLRGHLNGFDQRRLLNLLIDKGILTDEDAIALLQEGTEQLADAPHAAARLRTLKTSKR